MPPVRTSASTSSASPRNANQTGHHLLLTERANKAVFQNAVQHRGDRRLSASLDDRCVNLPCRRSRSLLSIRSSFKDEYSGIDWLNIMLWGCFPLLSFAKPVHTFMQSAAAISSPVKVRAVSIVAASLHAGMLGCASGESG